MKHFPTQAEYLSQNNIENLSETQIETLKKEYRLLYFKEYNKRKRKYDCKITLHLTKEEFKIIKRFKNQHNAKSYNKLIKTSLKSYIEKTPYPHSKEDIENIQIHINQVSTKLRNINRTLNNYLRQISPQEKQIHNIESFKRVLEKVIKQLLASVKTMQVNLSRYYSHPPLTILQLSWEDIRKNKTKLNELIMYLEKHRNSLP